MWSKPGFLLLCQSAYFVMMILIQFHHIWYICDFSFELIKKVKFPTFQFMFRIKNISGLLHWVGFKRNRNLQAETKNLPKQEFLFRFLGKLFWGFLVLFRFLVSIFLILLVKPGSSCLIPGETKNLLVEPRISWWNPEYCWLVLWITGWIVAYCFKAC